MKKRKFIGFALLSVVLGMLFIFSANAQEEAYSPAENDAVCPVRADVNSDGQLDPSDARQILRLAVSLEKAGEAEAIAADVDGDGEITPADARLALRIAVGLDPLPSHTRAFSLTLQTPTCQVTGLAASVCAYCSHTFNPGVLPKVDHQSAGWETIEKATCTNEGYAIQKCAFCDQVTDTKTIEKRPHEYDYSKPVFTEETPDCTRAQNVSFACINCGEIYETIRQPSKLHSFDWVSVSAPTCTDPGREELICTVCGTKDETAEYRPIPSLGFDEHSPEWIVEREATPEENGLRVYRCAVCGIILDEEEFEYEEDEPPVDQE